MKSHLPALAGTTLIICAVVSTATGQNLGAYTFDGTGGDSDTPVTTNSTFTPFSRTGLIPGIGADRFQSILWTSGDAQNTNQYVQFTVTPDPGYLLSLTLLAFDMQRSVDGPGWLEQQGPLDGQVQIFRGVSLNPVQSQDLTPIGSWQTVQVNLVDFTTADGEPVTVRFYGWNSGGWLGILELDNVTLEGVVIQAPEPSPATPMLLGAMLFVAPGALRRC